MRNFLCFLGLLFSISAPGAETCTKIRAYGNPEYPPYLWRATGSETKMAGAIVDAAALISSEIKIPIEVVFGGTWARVQEEARYGRVDLVAGAFWTKKREAYLDYLQPPLSPTHTVIWVRAEDKLNYQGWPSLKGMQGVTVINNSFGQKFDEYARAHLKITYVAGLKQAIEMLRKKRVRYLIYEEWPARSFLARYRIAGLKSLEPKVAEEQLFFAMAKKSPCANKMIEDKIAAALDKLNKKNQMPELLKTNSQSWDQEPQ